MEENPYQRTHNREEEHQIEWEDGQRRPGEARPVNNTHHVNKDMDPPKIERNNQPRDNAAPNPITINMIMDGLQS